MDRFNLKILQNIYGDPTNNIADGNCKYIYNVVFRFYSNEIVNDDIQPLFMHVEYNLSTDRLSSRSTHDIALA